MQATQEWLAWRHRGVGTAQSTLVMQVVAAPHVLLLRHLRLLVQSVCTTQPTQVRVSALQTGVCPEQSVLLAHWFTSPHVLSLRHFPLGPQSAAATHGTHLASLVRQCGVSGIPAQSPSNAQPTCTTRQA